MWGLCVQQLLEFVVFEESVILEEPVERWPLCDCLISFYATDFPLDKAIAYVQLRKPYVINDLPKQYALLCRAKIYQTLQSKGIDIPRHVVLNRDKGTLTCSIGQNRHSLCHVQMVR